MEKQNIEIKVAEGQQELIIREGNAETCVPRRKQVKVSGTIGLPLAHLQNPSPWLTKNVEDNAPLHWSYLSVDRDKMQIVFIEDAGAESESEYKGALSFSEEFLKFNINSSESLTPLALAEKIKMNRACFESKTEAMKLVSVLMNFEAKVNKEVEAKVDERANRRIVLAQTVSTNIPQGFKLNIPIFKGIERISFEVEIGIDPADLSCRLISPEANDIVTETKNEVIDEQLAQIKELHKTLRIFEV